MIHRLVLAAALLLALPLRLSTQSLAPKPLVERDVRPGAAGANRLELDVAILAAADPVRFTVGRDAEGRERITFAGGLRDLRFYDSSNTEVPYLVIPPAQTPAEWVSAKLLRVAPKKGASGFEADLGSPVVCDRFRIDGIEPPFMKRFRLEGSGDRRHWVLLVGDGTLFDLPEEKLRRTEISFARGEIRYFRLTWDDRSSARVQMPAAAAARTVGETRDSTSLRVPLELHRRVSEPGRSRYAIRLPGSRLPIRSLELDIRGGGPVLRDASVTEARLTGDQVTSHVLGSATLRRAGHGDVTAEDFRIVIDAPAEPEVELVVEDADNPPLDLMGVFAEMVPLPWIYFESAGAEMITARYGGGAVAPPRYDLEARRALVGKEQIADARWGDQREAMDIKDVPKTSPIPLAGSEIETGEFGYSRKIPAGEPGLCTTQLDAAVLAHSHSLADIRIADAAGRQVPYLLERRGGPLAVELGVPKRSAEKGQGIQGERSTYLLRLPYDTLPDSTLVLETSARVFDRAMTVGAMRPPIDARSESWVELLATSSWRHAEEDRPARPLAIPLPAPRAGELILTIEEGDNAALPLTGIRLLLPSYRLRFFRGAGAELRLLYGNAELARPKYDMTLLAPRLMGAAALEVEAAAESAAAPVSPAAGLGQKKIFWAAIIAAVAILLLLLVKLLVKPQSSGAGDEK